MKTLSERVNLDESPAPPSVQGWLDCRAAWPSIGRRKIIHTFVERFVVGGRDVEVRYLLPGPTGSEEMSQPRPIRPPTIQTHTGGRIYIRLPKPGTQCPCPGLSRAKLNDLILPNERNGFNPPVSSQEPAAKGRAARHPASFVGEPDGLLARISLKNCCRFVLPVGLYLACDSPQPISA
jgi:hypothetical protein